MTDPTADAEPASVAALRWLTKVAPDNRGERGGPRVPWETIDALFSYIDRLSPKPATVSGEEPAFITTLRDFARECIPGKLRDEPFSQVELAKIAAWFERIDRASSPPAKDLTVKCDGCDELLTERHDNGMARYFDPCKHCCYERRPRQAEPAKEPSERERELEDIVQKMHGVLSDKEEEKHRLRSELADAKDFNLALKRMQEARDGLAVFTESEWENRATIDGILETERRLAEAKREVAELRERLLRATAPVERVKERVEAMPLRPAPSQSSGNSGEVDEATKGLAAEVRGHHPGCSLQGIPLMLASCGCGRSGRPPEPEREGGERITREDISALRDVLDDCTEAGNHPQSLRSDLERLLAAAERDLAQSEKQDAEREGGEVSDAELEHVWFQAGCGHREPHTAGNRALYEAGFQAGLRAAKEK